jgi:hypothetical protein
VLVDLCVGAVDDVRIVVGLAPKVLEQFLENTSAIPPRESGVDCLPWTEASGQIAPRHARLRDEKNSVEKNSVGQLNGSTWIATLWRKQRLEAVPLGV